MTPLPRLSPQDFEGCQTAEQAADRLLGIMDEESCLPELSEMDERTFQRYLGFYLFGLTLREVLERGAEMFKARSEARTAGLRSLPYAHDGEVVFKVVVSAD